MQTLELGSRLVKRWGMGLGNMPAHVQQSLLDCINDGLQAFYAECPAIYREAPFGGVLAAPQAITAGFTNGSNTFTGFTAAASSYFATLRITSDTMDQVMQPPSTLLNNYNGTTGTQPATLYGDTIPLPSNIERIIDEPALEGHRHRLVRNDEYWGTLWGEFGATGGFWLGPWTGNGSRRRVSIPRTYWVEGNAMCQGNGPAFVLRVDPVPETLYQIRGRALFYPVRLPMSALQNNVPVPIQDAWVERLLIPIILGKMVEDDLWKNKANAKLTLNNRDLALQKASLLSPETDKPNYRCETPAGW